ncbi:cell division cycle protein 20-like protein [Dinothrombium tinctorium]|uniref:Cell division cycle protein 20-like protein n=1 Tax=Dinothrombium tinctorium TaxID=1965070 RepID=A0A443QGD4_9ACAR|nr:cell division cycle protein 20-like protein [Dinothrombium tinctorium]
MSHFDVDNELKSATSLDQPLTRGPIARWQRKNFESSTTSLNHSLNLSLHLNLTSNDSVLNSTSVPYGSSSMSGCKTPSHTPNKSVASKTTPNCSSKLNSSQGQKKTPKTPSHAGDRFIPNRSAMNLDLSHYLVTQNDKSCKENECEIRNNKIDEALNGDLSNYRILCCQEKGISVDARNGLNVLYSAHKQVTVKKNALRSIPAQPERILDAPDILNDYYLQLVDWSDNNILAVALNRELYLWNAATGEIDNLLQFPECEYIASVAWVEGMNNKIAVGGSNGEVQIWDSDIKKKLRTMRIDGQSERIASLSWNPCYPFLVSSGSRNGKIFHHDVRAQNHHVGTFSGHAQEVCGLKWAPGGQFLASGGNDNKVNIWSKVNISNDTSNKPIYTLNDKPTYTFSDNHSAIKAIAWSPWKSNLLATGGGTADKRIRIWNINDGTCVNSIDSESQICSILWSKEYKELISAHGYPNNELILWKYPGITKITELTGHTARILDMVMSPDGSTVVSLGADETLRFWQCFQIDGDKKKKAEVKAYKEQLSSNPMRLQIR